MAYAIAFQTQSNSCGSLLFGRTAGFGRADFSGQRRQADGGGFSRREKNRRSETLCRTFRLRISGLHPASDRYSTGLKKNAPDKRRCPGQDFQIS